MKEKRESNDKNNVVYKKKFKFSESLSIGDSERVGKQRKGDYMRSVNKKEEKSRTINHAVETRGYKFNFNNIEGLATETWENTRQT